MSRQRAIWGGLLAFTVAPLAHATGDLSYRQTEARPSASAATPDKVVKPEAAKRDQPSQDWMLSLEGVGTAPTDLGAQVGLETPFGLHVFGGYGWMPADSLRWLRGMSVSSGGASATIDVADASGYILRLKAGLRPFPRLGLYLDGGYARAELAATLNVTGSVTNVGSIAGGYHAASSIDLWLVELGYQWKIENRLIVGIGVGFMGTMSARTTITPTGAAANRAIEPAVLTRAQTAVNGALEGYGFLPTLTLRVGFNVL